MIRSSVLVVLPVLATVLAGPTFAAPASSAAAQEAKAIVTELVACGTRHSLSSWTDPKRGIGCGRDIVVRRHFGGDRREARRPAQGDRRQVRDERPAHRQRTVPMENVYAVLEGTDPSRRKTAYVVSGHLDSRASDVMDTKIDAPGADDDGSGVIGRRSSRRRPWPPRPEGFRATLVFAAVAGEEQGLLGSKRIKEWLGQQGYQVGGMITDDIVGATNGSKDRRPRVFSEGGPDGVDSPGRRWRAGWRSWPGLSGCGWSSATTASAAAAIICPSPRPGCRRSASPSRWRSTTTSTRPCASRRGSRTAT